MIRLSQVLSMAYLTVFFWLVGTLIHFSFKFWCQTPLAFLRLNSWCEVRALYWISLLRNIEPSVLQRLEFNLTVFSALCCTSVKNVPKSLVSDYSMHRISVKNGIINTLLLSVLRKSCFYKVSGSVAEGQEHQLSADFTFDSPRQSQPDCSACSNQQGTMKRVILQGTRLLSPHFYRVTKNLKALRKRFYVNVLWKKLYQSPHHFNQARTTLTKQNRDSSSLVVRKTWSISFLLGVEKSTLIRLPATWMIDWRIRRFKNKASESLLVKNCLYCTQCPVCESLRNKTNVLVKERYLRNER